MKDRVLVGLLALALVQAVALAARAWQGPPALPLPVAVPPGQDADLALRAQVATVGDWVTVEDLARGALALERGELPGVAPLTDGERAELRALVEQAERDRAELLRVEGELMAAQDALDAQARALAASLTPEQRAWVVEQRDVVSVGQVEAAYWAELATLLEAP